MNKKGLLFAVSTILLLLPVFIFSRMYFDTLQDRNDFLVENSIAAKLQYLEDDVINNIYTDLLPYAIDPISRVDSMVIVNFTKTMKLQDSRDFDDRLTTYQNYVEGLYSLQQNYNITLTNFSPNVTIEPYGSLVDLSQNTLYVYNNDSKLTDITITVQVDENSLNQNTSSTTAGSTNLRIIALNEDDEIKSDTTDALDPTAENTFTYKSGSDALFTVTFGSFSDLPNATLEIKPDVYAEVREVSLQFTEETPKTVLSGGQISIKSLTGNISKVNKIVLIEE